MAPLKAVVVGAGLMGRWHARYAARAGAEITAVVDREAEAARALAARHGGASVFGTLGDCLMAGPVDVAHICTPTESHFALAREALLGGVHVLVEKPAAATQAEAVVLVETARERGRVLVPVHQTPFQHGFRRLRDTVTRLGELVAVEYRMCSAGGEGKGPRERRSILFEVLPHADSLLRALLRERYAPEALEVMAQSPDDLVLAGVAAGIRIQASMSLRGRPPRHELHVLGTRGSGMADLFHGYCVLEGGDTSRTAKALRPFAHAGRVLAAASANLIRRSAGREPAYPGLRPLIAAFYAATRGSGTAPIGEAEIVGSVGLIDRARATVSAAAGDDDER